MSGIKRKRTKRRSKPISLTEIQVRDIEAVVCPREHRWQLGRVRKVDVSSVKPTIGASLEATEDIDKGSVVATYSGDVLNEQENLVCQQKLDANRERSSYLFGVRDYYGRKWVLDGWPGNENHSLGSFINDARGLSVTNNVVFEPVCFDQDDTLSIDWSSTLLSDTSFGGGSVCVLLIATRDIAAKEELFADYGKDYWTLR